MMQPIPVAQGMFFCDQLIIEQGTLKASAIGMFEGQSADRFPAFLSPFTVFALLSGGLGQGTMSLEVARLDTGEVVFRQDDEWTFGDKLEQLRYVLHLQGLILPEPGAYQFTLLADDQWVAQKRLRMRKRRIGP